MGSKSQRRNSLVAIATIGLLSIMGLAFAPINVGIGPTARGLDGGEDVCQSLRTQLEDTVNKMQAIENGLKRLDAELAALESQLQALGVTSSVGEIPGVNPELVEGFRPPPDVPASRDVAAAMLRRLAVPSAGPAPGGDAEAQAELLRSRIRAVKGNIASGNDSHAAFKVVAEELVQFVQTMC